MWRKIESFIRIYGLSIVIGAMLTMWAVDYSMRWRGYLAFGGECLILPAAIYARYLILLMQCAVRCECSKRAYRRAKTSHHH